MFASRECEKYRAVYEFIVASIFPEEMEENVEKIPWALT